MLEWIKGEYRFVGYPHGVVNVYVGMSHVDTFLIHIGIKDEEILINESKLYLKIVEQKY